MKTITVSIGNTDNKLTQAEWAEFVEGVNKVVLSFAKDVHFFGGSANWMPWQNVAWILDCEDDKIFVFKESITFWRILHNQDSAFYSEAVPEFI